MKKLLLLTVLLVACTTSTTKTEPLGTYKCGDEFYLEIGDKPRIYNDLFSVDVVFTKLANNNYNFGPEGEEPLIFKYDSENDTIHTLDESGAETGQVCTFDE